MDIQQIIERVRPADESAMRAAREHQDRLTKPRGSLGRLEELSVQLAGLAGQTPPPVPAPAAVAVFAGDHGVHAQGVTPWPQEVTQQMVSTFLAGGAVINALADHAGAQVVVVDIGMAVSMGDAPGLLDRNVRRGTADMTVEPAMTRAEAIGALEAGAAVAAHLIAGGARCLITGDMGIANTTPSAALISVLAGVDARSATGRGTGIDDATHAVKVSVVEQAIARHAPDPADPIGVLAAVGGLEHAALAGFMLEAAASRVPVILDGVIACSAALIAAELAPAVTAALIAGHRSVEPGATVALERLGLTPILSMDLRLGEGSGAVLALPILQSAAVVLNRVATFDSAGVTDKHES